MNGTIWKYELPMETDCSISMPAGAQVLSVDVQYGSPCIWALVDTEAPQQIHHFKVRGTGHPCPDVNPGNFVGTFQLHGGALVFHLFKL